MRKDLFYMSNIVYTYTRDMQFVVYFSVLIIILKRYT